MANPSSRVLSNGYGPPPNRFEDTPHCECWNADRRKYEPLTPAKKAFPMNVRRVILPVILASAGCSQQAGAPVDQSVAAAGTAGAVRLDAVTGMSSGSADSGFVAIAVDPPSGPDTTLGERHLFPDGSVEFYAEIPASPTAPSSISGPAPQVQTRPITDAEALPQVPQGPTITEGSIASCSVVGIGTPNVCTPLGATPYACPVDMHPFDGNCRSSGVRTPPSAPRILCCNPNP